MSFSSITSISSSADSNSTSPGANAATEHLSILSNSAQETLSADQEHREAIVTTVSSPQLPREIWNRIWGQHIQKIALRRNKLKMRLPLGSTLGKRNPPAFICYLPAPSLQHVNRGLREQSKSFIPKLPSPSPIDVYETQHYEPGLRRRMYFPYVSMVEVFNETLSEAGAARSMNVEAVLVRCQRKDDHLVRGSLVKLAKGLATLKVMYVVKKTKSSEEAIQLVKDIYDELKLWQQSQERAGYLPGQWRIPGVIVVSPQNCKIRGKNWTAVWCVRLSTEVERIISL